MIQRLLEINKSNLIYEIDDEDKIFIKFQNEDIHQISYSNLVFHSKYIRDKYIYSEAKECIQKEIEQIKKEYKIKDDCIKFFIDLIQHEKVNIPFEFKILSDHSNK